MTQLADKITKTYQLISVTCQVLYNIDWMGNYSLYQITDKDMEFIDKASTIKEYFKRFEELVKDKILKNYSNINTITWNVKMFDETISLHIFIKEIGLIIEQYIKTTLTKKYPRYANHINKINTDYNKTIIVEIFNNDKIIFAANLDVAPFLNNTF